MTECGMLFYCDHLQPVSALAVALWTLKRLYHGPIQIVFGPDAPNWLVGEVSNKKGVYGGITCERLESYDFLEWTNGKRGAWCQKPFAIRRSPFELTLYFDCDHLFVGSQWPGDIWGQIDRLGLASGHDKLFARRCPRVIRDVRAVTGIALDAYRPVNGGCIGYRRGHEGWQTWIAFMTQFARQWRSRLLRDLAEEHGLGLTLNTGIGGWIDGAISRTEYPHAHALGYHLNGGRYLYCPRWQQEFRNCFDADFLGIRTNAAAFLQSNAQLKSIISRSGESQIPDESLHLS